MKRSTRHRDYVYELLQLDGRDRTGAAWDTEEDNLLRILYSMRYAPAVIAYSLARSVKAVCHRAARLHLPTFMDARCDTRELGSLNALRERGYNYAKARLLSARRRTAV